MRTVGGEGCCLLGEGVGQLGRIADSLLERRTRVIDCGSAVWYSCIEYKEIEWFIDMFELMHLE